MHGFHTYTEHALFLQSLLRSGYCTGTGRENFSAKIPATGKGSPKATNLADDGDVLVKRKKFVSGRSMGRSMHLEDVWQLVCSIKNKLGALA